MDVVKRPRGRPPTKRRRSIGSDNGTSNSDRPYRPGVVDKKKKRSSGISGTKKNGLLVIKGNWTVDEDRRLAELVMQYNLDRDHRGTGSNTRWSEIAKQLPCRVGKQCRERYYFHE